MFMQFTPYEQTLKIFMEEQHSSYNHQENNNLIQFDLFFLLPFKFFKTL